MTPYPSPIADCIERCAAAMTSPRVLENPDYAAEWSMTMMHCADMVRAMEMPDVRITAASNIRVQWRRIGNTLAILSGLVVMWVVLRLAIP